MTSYTVQEAEAALKPSIEKYFHAINNEVWDEVEDFYHPNGVVVQKDTEAVYGKKEIGAHLRKFAEETGKSVATISNEKYEGVGDYLIIRADFSAETEKAGIVKGKFLQIWKKDGDRHRIYHDEFEVIP